MRTFDLSGLDMGHIQAFVAVASVKSFTKAAELLHLSQPVVSKRVAALESRLGFQLFIRWRRTIKLTPAGNVLYNAWSDLTHQILEPINRANACHMGYSHHLTVAYCASSYAYQVGELFQEEHPNANISFIRTQYPQMQSKLLSGEVDIAFYGAFALQELNHSPLKCQVLRYSPLSACMLPSNPLAAKKKATVADLRGQDFIMLSPLVAPVWLSFMTELCIKNRFAPHVSLYVEDTASLHMNLRNDHSVFLTDRYCTAVDTSRVDLALVELTDTVGGTMAIWNEENENKLIPAFVEKSAVYWNTID